MRLHRLREMRVGIAAGAGFAEHPAQLLCLLGAAEVGGFEERERGAQALRFAGSRRGVHGNGERDDARTGGCEMIDEAGVDVARPGPFAEPGNAGVVDGDDDHVRRRIGRRGAHHAVVEHQLDRRVRG